MTNEQLRLAHCPNTINLLFIGESPPASGRFFYARNSGLYRAVFEAFQTVHPVLAEPEFLNAFKSAGCYLVDLCPDPVDHLPMPVRRAARRASEPSLATQIQHLRPRQIVTTLRSIETHVQNAVDQADWTGPILTLPYPGRWQHHKAAFIDTLNPIIKKLTIPQ